jgi:hypothetical protein
MPDMINPQKGIYLMNNDSIINRILFAVTIFQWSHGPYLQHGSYIRSNLGISKLVMSTNLY